MAPETQVLTLLASIGAEAEWCDPRLSANHQAIALTSVEMVERAPMIAQLIRGMGIAIADVVSPEAAVGGAPGKTYDVFHVEHALGSQFIPAQDDFVKPYGIRSVIGFGGLLPGGDLFAVIMFSRVQVGVEQARRFRNIALDVKAIIHPFATWSPR